MRSVQTLHRMLYPEDLNLVIWSPVLSPAKDYPFRTSFMQLGPQILTYKKPSLPKSAQEFLDKALRNGGANSVIYIAFGSVYWPPDVLQTESLFEAILDCGLSVLVIPSGSIMTDDCKAALAHAMEMLGDKAMSIDWIDQVAVLEHPVSYPNDFS